MISSKDIFASFNCSLGYFLSVGNFIKKFSSSSFGSCHLGVKIFIIFFANVLRIVRIFFDLLSSNIV